MKNKKNINIEATELFMAKAGKNGWDRCFHGTIRREKDVDGTPVVLRRIEVNNGFKCAMASNQDELGWKLNEMVRMVLGCQYIA